MLAGANPVCFVATAKPDEAARFYGETLGLRLVSDDPFAVAFDLHGTMLRVQKVETVPPAPFTVLGWDVPDIAAAVDGLAARGVTFARYLGLDQDARGVWRAPSGAQVAWFTDPDGNTLSLTQF